MQTRRRFLELSLALPALGIAAGARAEQSPVFADGGIAIRGTDPVSYFDDAMPVAGRAAYALMWDGAIWHFASAANRERFEMDPTAYAPRYGGYCAFAMAQGYIASSVPDAWTIHDGRLYLNFSLSVRDRWSRNIPGNIEKADLHWPAILET